MITITIQEEAKTKNDLVYLLQQIAEQIEEGYSSGYNPNWVLSGEEEIDKD